MDRLNRKKIMANFTLKQFKIPEEDQNWLVYFIFSSWIIITILFAADLPHEILKEKFEAKKQKIVQVLLENKDNENSEKNVIEEKFLSNKANSGSGSLTQKKGFHNLSENRELEFSESGNESTKQNEQLLKSLSKPEKTGYKTSINKTHSKSGEKSIYKSSGQHTTIPENYQFKDEFAFSYDNNGNPVIPTVEYKNYEYFKSMLNKIQNNWAPPGGTPYPVYGDSYHSQSFVPGRTSYQTFPSQEIKVVFTLDAEGNVLDAVVWDSLRSLLLDKSCVEAIKNSRNFGAVPPELLMNNQLTMPLIFKIIDKP